MPKAKPAIAESKTSDIKSDFITIASHQLRTPLAGVRWSLDTLLAGKVEPLTAKQRAIVAEAYASNNFLIKSVNGLMRAARLEERGTTMAPQFTDIKKIVEELINHNQNFLRANNGTITLKLPTAATKAYIDPLQIKPVIEGIIDNAIRYGQGACRIIIGLKTVGNRYLLVSVNDNGIGIPASQQSLLFSRFFRAKNAMKAQTEGLGLDLYIAKKIIEASGGKITFHSVEKKGTTFKLLLPIKKTASLIPAAAKPEAKTFTPQEALKQEREFVNITVHELKAPLGATKWSLEMLKAQKVGGLNQPQIELIDQIYRGNERLLVLVRDLLDLAKLQAGRFDVSPKPVSLETIITDVVAGFKPEAAQKKIRISAPSRLALPRLIGDPNRIAQVVTNLVSNAIKYTPQQGTVTIAVNRWSGRQLQALGQKTATADLQHISNPRGYLVLSVADTGIGISKAEQAKLFTRFFRGHSVLKSKTEGTGLGLYITKTIVNLHGGDIWFTSQPDKGSTFYFSLPIG